MTGSSTPRCACAGSVGYANAGTFEFLVDASGRNDDQPIRLHRSQRAVGGGTYRDRKASRASISCRHSSGLPKGRRSRSWAWTPPRFTSRGDMPSRLASAWRRIGEDGSIHPSAGTLSCLRGPQWPGRAHGRIRLQRLPHQPVVRLATCQSDRPFVFTQLRRCRRQDRPRVERVPHRGCRHEYSLSCRASWLAMISSPALSTPASSMSGSPAWRPRARRVGASSSPSAAPPLSLPLRLRKTMDLRGPEGSIGLVSPIQGTVVHRRGRCWRRGAGRTIGGGRRGDEASARHQGGPERGRLRRFHVGG